MKKYSCFLWIFFLILPACSTQKSITRLVLMPDTQTYASRFPKVFRSQTEWIASNAEQIDFVLHQGDITDNK